MNNGLSILEDLFQQIIGPFAATQVTPLLFEPDNVEDRVSNLMNVFNQHPQLIPPFQTLIKSLNPQDLAVPLEENIRFYTTSATRLWLIINLLNQVLKIKELKMDDATGKLPGKTHDLLKFACEARTQFGEESRYKDYTFSVGLLFDFFFYLQKSSLLNLGGAKFDEPINQAFARAVEQGQVILKLSKYKKKLSQDKLAPITCFIRQLAQVSIYLLKPGVGVEFYKKLSTLKHTEPVRLALEMNTFGVHTGILSTYITQMIPAFTPLEKAMSVWGAPYLSWMSGQRDVHDLSAMGILGMSLKERLKGADFPGAGQVGATLPELFYLDLALTSEVKNETKI